MFPNNSQSHTDAPANLPPISNAGQPQQPSQPLQPTPAAALQATSATVHYVAQTKQLIAQYGNDPFRLSVALSQVKSAYLSEQFHITTNQTGS